MKKSSFGIIVLAVFVASILVIGQTGLKETFAQGSMSSMMQTCQSMMNKAPDDVIIKTISPQQVKPAKESSVTLLVLDKKTNKPMNNANVILHIERGAPMESMSNMTMMDMMKKMVSAENVGDGQYLVKFMLEEKGYYTMHTHVIPPGKSMMSMMNNHMDIGIIVK